jgi:hypothetical protein
MTAIACNHAHRTAAPYISARRRHWAEAETAERPTDNTCAVIAETSPVFASRVAFQA